MELDSCLWHVSAALLNPLPFFPFTLLLAPLSQHLKTKGGIIGMQEDCFHSAAIKPSRMEGEWKALCFVLFFRCYIEFLALGCTSGQTIIAFSSLGSSLFSIWSLPMSDFTVRGWGCSEAGERKTVPVSIISCRLPEEHGGIDSEPRESLQRTHTHSHKKMNTAAEHCITPRSYTPTVLYLLLYWNNQTWCDYLFF